jgi:gluconate kinase
MDEAWLITGIPGAGKSTVARLLGQRLERAAHIEGDRFGEMIRSGAVYPGEQPEEESRRQMELSRQQQWLLAHSFAEAGFTPILDYVVVSRNGVASYQEGLAPLRLHLLVLDPGRDEALRRDLERPEKTVAAPFLHLEEPLGAELRGIGLWIDSRGLTAEATVDLILRQRERARL